MEASKLSLILDQHKLWFETNGMHGQRAVLRDTNLYCANLINANLSGANLTGAKLWGANLKFANLKDANLGGAILTGANLINADLGSAILTGAYLCGANLTNTILPDISWIKAGCLVQLNRINSSFYLEKENKFKNFVQDSLGFFIQDNPIEKTFDMLVEDKIIRGIPDWVKYTGLKPVE